MEYLFKGDLQSNLVLRATFMQHKEPLILMLITLHPIILVTVGSSDLFSQDLVPFLRITRKYVYGILIQERLAK